MIFNHAISWFEIPALDLPRATKFYETIFEISMIPLTTEGFKMSMFPVEDMQTSIGGCLIDSSGFHRPSTTEGPLIYLNGNPDLQVVLDRVAGAGGTVQIVKTMISEEYGYMGVFLDTEGNRVGLHSTQ